MVGFKSIITLFVFYLNTLRHYSLCLLGIFFLMRSLLTFLSLVFCFVVFFPYCPQDFYLLSLLFSSLTIMCLSVFFFILACLGFSDVLGSVVCCQSLNLEICFLIISSNISCDSPPTSGLQVKIC